MTFPPENRRIYSESSVRQFAPTGPGIYVLFSNARCVYIGKAENVKAQLLEHATGQSRESGCISTYRANLWLFVPAPSNKMTATVNRLIGEFHPVCNET